MRLSGINIGARVYLVLVIALIVGINMGCSNEGPIAPANTGLVFQQSPSGGQWISNQETTISWEIDPRFGSIYESFMAYYSVDSGDYWLLIDNTLDMTIDWTIPSEVNSANCLVKVVGCSSDSAIITDVVSELFSIIPFGMIDHFIVSAPDVVIHSTNFVLSVTAKDSYDNVVTNYDSVGYIFLGTSLDMFGMYYTGHTIGDGLTTGVWNNGKVSHHGFSECFLGMTSDTTYYLSVGIAMDGPLPGFGEVLYIDNLE